MQIPFEGEEQIRYNVDYHSNREMEAVIQNHRQFSALLSVDLTSIEKPTEDAQGGVRIVDSEDDGGGGGEDEMDDEQEGDEEY